MTYRKVNAIRVRLGFRFSGAMISNRLIQLCFNWSQGGADEDTRKAAFQLFALWVSPTFPYAPVPPAVFVLGSAAVAFEVGFVTCALV